MGAASSNCEVGETMLETIFVAEYLVQLYFKKEIFFCQEEHFKIFYEVKKINQEYTAKPCDSYVSMKIFKIYNCLNYRNRIALDFT